MPKIKPLGRRLLIKVQDTEEEDVGGIILPENRTELPTEGVVTDVGYGGDKPLCAKNREKGFVSAPGHVKDKNGGDTDLLGDGDDVFAVGGVG